MRDLIAERKNALQSSIVPSGHVYARRAAAAALSLPGYRDEQWHGRSQHRFVHELAGSFDKSKGMLKEKLARLKELIFTRHNLTVNITADTEGLNLTTDNLGRLLERLPAGATAATAAMPPLHPVRAGIVIPSQVSYVACGMKAPAYSSQAAALLTLASREISNSYLYKHIRVQGGAYGGMSSFDPMQGVFAFMSYRDPHIAGTLKVYDEARKFYSENDMTADDLQKAIISSLGALDKPMDPEGRGYVAMIRAFSGATDQMRQSFRNQIFSAEPRQVREALAGYFAKAAPGAAVAVYAAQEKLEEANRSLDRPLNIEKLTEA